MNRAVLSLDIGSTYTKGALFELVSNASRLVRRHAVPTTVERLADGVGRLLGRLLDLRPERAMAAAARDIPLYACSSAKGGLTIAATGIVPDLTLHVARLAAASAGGKVVAHYAYRLADLQIAELERLQPDILLFCGGTDGGNEQYNVRNAEKLAQSGLRSTVLYAGNAAVRDRIGRILADRETIFTDNVMPEIGTLQVEPARNCIQEIFLRRIVEGKGLAEISSLCASELKPTPRAVFNLLNSLSRTLPEWDDSVWIDLGGATTDFYSCTEPFRGEQSFVLRGLREPRLKRTVEGDLGLRVSAPSVVEAAEEYLTRELGREELPLSRMADYAAKVQSTTDSMPTDPEQRRFDDLLARACVYHAMLRHAGRIEESYCPEGKLYVQHGKDLRGVRKWIGGGGYLARRGSAEMYRDVLAAAHRDSGGLRLIPQPDEFYADTDNLLPLLGNLVDDHPIEAAQLATRHLRRIK